nr:MAG TPA: hypothetical protein [Caudoviricetes sp.]
MTHKGGIFPPFFHFPLDKSHRPCYSISAGAIRLSRSGSTLRVD